MSRLFLLHLFLLCCAVSSVNAGLYVVNPRNGATCAAGQPCTVDWLDDGSVPLLTSIGPSAVGLYHGSMQIVQMIGPVDVSSNHSLTFTPDAQAGPDSDTYFICFTSLALANASDASSPYQAFSPSFSLSGMSGSFSSPVASLTSSIPVPSSLTQSAASASSTSVSTVGTLVPASSLTSLTPSVTPSSTSTSSGFSTSRTATGTSAASTGTASASAAWRPHGSTPLMALPLLAFAMSALL